MKAIRSSFMQMLVFIRRDKMLLVICFTPLLASAFFKFGIPVMEQMLSEWIGNRFSLEVYYGLFDVFFAMLTPIMFCYITAMVILEEHDDHITSYVFTTPLRRKGYLISRILIPAILGLMITTFVLPIFKLTVLSIIEIISLSLMGALQGVIIALLVVTLSSNKLEGMAIAKLSTLTILGALIPFFVFHQIQYFFFFLPSYWGGKAVCTTDMLYLLPSILFAILWIYVLLKKFLIKYS